MCIAPPRHAGPGGQRAVEADAEDLEAKVEDLTLAIKTLTVEIEALKAEIAELQLQLKRAGEDREKGTKESQMTIADQRVTQ